MCFPPPVQSKVEGGGDDDDNDDDDDDDKDPDEGEERGLERNEFFREVRLTKRQLCVVTNH